MSVVRIRTQAPGAASKRTSLHGAARFSQECQQSTSLQLQAPTLVDSIGNCGARERDLLPGEPLNGMLPRGYLASTPNHDSCKLASKWLASSSGLRRQLYSGSSEQSSERVRGSAWPQRVGRVFVAGGQGQEEAAPAYGESEAKPQLAALESTPLVAAGGVAPLQPEPSRLHFSIAHRAECGAAFPEGESLGSIGFRLERRAGEAKQLPRSTAQAWPNHRGGRKLTDRRAVERHDRNIGWLHEHGMR